jgi:ABC-type transport system involved in multi-copper enzyme maturation permease subunit
MTALTQFRETLREQPWELWSRQIRTIVRMDLKKNFLSRRGIWIYLLAFAPVAIIAAHAVFVLRHMTSDPMEVDTQVLAGIFQFYYLRLGIFFGCLGIFTWLIRGEIIEKSLHYYFLSPVRREVLLIGKFLCGLIVAVTAFGVGVFSSFVLMYLPSGEQGKFFVFNGPGLGHLAAYLGITVLACVGYGALFLALSLLLRNPVVAAMIVLGWETISPVLPSVLQRLSITFYLKQLCPVAVPVEGLLGLFTVVSEPVSTVAAVLGPIILAALVLFFACRFVRRVEISYVAE